MNPRSGWSRLLLQFSRNILVRATFFTLLSIAAEVLASRMLVLATFALGTLISARAVASGSTTPRVTELLMQDTRVQNAIGVFVGAFLFALAGLIGLGAGLCREHGGILLLLVTIAVIVVVVAVFLCWVDLVSGVGRIPDAVDRNVRADRIALDDRLLKALVHLAEGRQRALASAARTMTAKVAELAEASLTLASDRVRIRALATAGPGR